MNLVILSYELQALGHTWLRFTSDHPDSKKGKEYGCFIPVFLLGSY